MARQDKKEQKIIDLAIKRLEKCIKSDQHNRQAALEDLRFLNGEQWDEGEKKRRSDKGRPALQFNLLPKYVDQIVGDMLHNSPSIKVRPVDSRADVNIAKIRQGIISNIEYNSNSKGIYSYAGKQLVSCGYGAWRVLTRYTEENPFLQEAYLESIRNPFQVYLDPTAKDQNFADAKYGFILEKMSLDDFKDKYPNAQIPPSELKTGSGVDYEHWWDGERITVAEYFTVESETVVMVQLQDGRVIEKEKFKEIHDEWLDKNNKFIYQMEMPKINAPEGGVSIQRKPPVSPAPQSAPAAPPQMPGAGGQPPMVPNMGVPAPQTGALPPQVPGVPPVNPMVQAAQRTGEEPKIVKERDTEKTIIRHRILTCVDIIEGGSDGNVFPGKYIPIVLAKGKELNIEGKNYICGLVRNGKDSQKMLNYWNTAAAETIALAPKAPWLGTPKQFEGYENDYAASNVENYPFLKYNVDPDAPGAPHRVQTPQPPAAIFQMIVKGEETLKSCIGMFNADVGAQGSEQTGAAIIARQRPGDIGTFEYMENLARAVLHTGRILNSIIPEIYDTERDVRLRNIDETETNIPINTTVGSALKSIRRSPRMYGVGEDVLKSMAIKDGKDAKFNDITAGKYDVVVTTGPSYATQRMESANQLIQLSQAMPQQMALASDLIVQNLDFKDSDELAARLRKTLPPGMVKPRPGDPPAMPPQPNPAQIAAQAKMQTEQAKVQMAQLKLQQEQLKLQEQQLKLKAEMVKMQQESGKNVDDKAFELQESMKKHRIDRDRLDLEIERFNHQREMDMANHTHKRNMEGTQLALDTADKFMGGYQGE